MKLLALLSIVVLFLSSCGNSYSPLDTYINTSIKSSEENYKSASQAKAFIDSLNNAGVKAYKK